MDELNISARVMHNPRMNQTTVFTASKHGHTLSLTEVAISLVVDCMTRRDNEKKETGSSTKKSVDEKIEVENKD